MRICIRRFRLCLLLWKSCLDDFSIAIRIKHIFLSASTTSTSSVNYYLLTVIVDNQVVYSDRIAFGTSLTDYAEMLITKYYIYSTVTACMQAIKKPVLKVHHSGPVSLIQYQPSSVKPDAFQSCLPGCYLPEPDGDSPRRGCSGTRP